jgi:hypothetical protein
VKEEEERTFKSVLEVTFINWLVREVQDQPDEVAKSQLMVYSNDRHTNEDDHRFSPHSRQVSSIFR